MPKKEPRVGDVEYSEPVCYFKICFRGEKLTTRRVSKDAKGDPFPLKVLHPTVDHREISLVELARMLQLDVLDADVKSLILDVSDLKKKVK